MTTLAKLKNTMSDREKVISWLNSIGETDPSCINEVLDQCTNDSEARKYFVWRYETACIKS